MCISAFGFGYEVGIGSDNISFYGYAEVPDFFDCFLEGSAVGPNGMALTFRNIAYEYDRFVGSSSPFRIDLNDIPADWGLEGKSFFYFNCKLINN